jgi:hypothetical protein
MATEQRSVITVQPLGTRERLSRLARAAEIDRSRHGPPAEAKPSDVLELLVERIRNVSQLVPRERGASWDPIDDVTAQLLLADLAMATRLMRAVATELGRTLETTASDLASASRDLARVVETHGAVP